MSHSSRHNMTSWSGVASWLLLICLVSSLLARTAAGSCLSYGHSCWGAHGKRSEAAPGAPADTDLAQDAESWDSEANNVEEPAWQKLRRFVTHRAHHAPPPPPPPRHVTSEEQGEPEQPPPRWLYQLMRQAAAMKLD